MTRRYDLVAFDTELLLLAARPGVRPGPQEVAFEIDESAQTTHLFGSVVAFDGSALSGVQVEARLGLRFSTGMAFLAARRTLTDANGRFDLGRTGRDGVFLHCSSENTIPRISDASPRSEETACVVALCRKLHARVHIVSDEARRAEFLCARTENGGTSFVCLAGGYGGAMVAMEGLEGQTLTVGEDVSEFALMLDGRVLGTRRVALDPSTTVEIDL